MDINNDNPISWKHDINKPIYGVITWLSTKLLVMFEKNPEKGKFGLKMIPAPAWALMKFADKFGADTVEIGELELHGKDVSYFDLPDELQQYCEENIGKAVAYDCLNKKILDTIKAEIC